MRTRVPASTEGSPGVSSPDVAAAQTPGAAAGTHHAFALDAAAWRALALLWLAGSGLRLTVLAVPPALPAIHRTLRLDEALVGALTSLPVLLLGLAAVPGSLLIARIGARRALVLGLLLVALAGAARGLGPTAPVLFAMTVAMGLGVAVSQPALPSLVRQWLPGRVGLATAAFSNGLLIGEIVPVALTATLILPLFGGSWPLGFVVWSLPVALTALAVLAFTPHAARGIDAPPLRWWPDWREARTWRLGLLLGCASTVYFNANAFVPDYLRATHHPELTTAALTALNLSQLPVSFLVAALPGRLIGRRWPVMGVGALTLAALAIFLSTGGAVSVLAFGLLGFSSASVLVLTLALPPLLAQADDVHRLSAALFTISYLCAFATSLAGGVVWDRTGIPATAFTLVAVGGAFMIVLARGLDLPPYRHAR